MLLVTKVYQSIAPSVLQPSVLSVHFLFMFAGTGTVQASQAEQEALKFGKSSDRSGASPHQPCDSKGSQHFHTGLSTALWQKGISSKVLQHWRGS